MAIRTSAYTVTVGTAQQFEAARAEDRRIQPTYLTAVDDPTPGVPVNFTNAVSITLRIRDKSTGDVLLVKNYSGFVGAASAGTPYFIINANDTVNWEPDNYDLDVEWYDGTNTEQLQLVSNFKLLDKITGGTITSQPSVPVTLLTYLNTATFPGTGTFAVGVTYPPIASGIVPRIFLGNAVTRDTDAIQLQVVETSITSTGCTVSANKDFIGYAPLFEF